MSVDSARHGLFLGNGHYSLWLPNGRGGFARCRGLALNDWNLDALETSGGWSLFLRDVASGQTDAFGDSVHPHALWTAAADGASLSLSCLGLRLGIDVSVPAEFDAELRRISVFNPGESVREITCLVATPVALNWPEAQAGHPAFARLFVQTRHLGASGTLVARRRPRASGERWPTLLSGLEVWDPNGQHRDAGWDTDRARFNGRGTSSAMPTGLTRGLFRTAGNVLDPVFARAVTLRIPPGETAHLCAWMQCLPVPDVTAETPESCDAQRLARRCLRESVFPGCSGAPVRSLGSDAADNGLPPRCLSGLTRQRSGRVCVPGKAVESVNTLQSCLHDGLLLWNGIGGFSKDGQEYIMHIPLAPDGPVLPPMPWINVMANPRFGGLVSETGSACTWSVNSHQHRLTPWYNDPLRDPHGEAFFLRDLDTGATWSPQAGPMRPRGGNEIRHGFGYSRFLQHAADVHQVLDVFVHADKPVKFSRLQLEHHGTTRKTLRIYSFARLVMAFHPVLSAPYVRVECPPGGRRLFASQLSPGEIGKRYAFAAVVPHPEVRAWSGGGCRHAFLGDSGAIGSPWAVMTGSDFSVPVCDDDPAFVQSVDVVLDPGQSVAVTFLLGDADSDQEREALIAEFSSDEVILEALSTVKKAWQDRLGRVQVRTPEAAIDVMLNGWLLYQTLSCRMWGRTALYQSSGAFGFRDQLQDSLAFLNTQPDITRRQILLHASRQFIEGDVQHWWHEPPLDRGLRTRFADDLNWLPLAVASYVECTGDDSLLDVDIGFLSGPDLDEGEDERYERAIPAGVSASVYEHCCLALDRSLTQGPHGLPLMGTGDWNDGMNRIGRLGIGESVWMGFFLHDILGRFLPLCRGKEDAPRIARYEAYRQHLFETLNAAGWDGEWYRRAWYDNGHVVGSKDSDECRIDALAQAWSVFSGVATGSRVDQVLASLEAHLVDPAARIVRLLTPPFVDTPDDPGYIKGYVAGVRENGGQYTHAAAWVVKAFAHARRHQRVADLFLATLPAVHTATAEGVMRLKTEPYVAVADIYGAAPHVGRGGWSWYTGSSGWLQRVGVESLLGIRWENGDDLVLDPCIPDEWPGFEANLRHADSLVVKLVVRRVSAGASDVLTARCPVVACVLEGTGVRLPLRGQSGELEVFIDVGLRSITHAPSASTSTEQS